jgi:hypothetical protein
MNIPLVPPHFPTLCTPLCPPLCPSLPPDCRDAAAFLNQGCVCHSVSHARLQSALNEEQGSGLNASVLKTHARLFSDTQVFVAEAHLKFMAELIAAIERVVALPAWREAALAQAPTIARHVPRAQGVFLGYDFHLGQDGPRLIEINTNAGGALLNAKLLHAQHACCASAASLPSPRPEAVFLAMFQHEWQLARGDRLLRRIAIVDEAPAGQFLAPEFELFRLLFESAGFSAQVVDPAELAFDGERLLHQGETIDLVYNRLTDFSLAEAYSADLRAAYLADAVVLTPHPRAHALYADKRNLVQLSDQHALRVMGVSATDRQLLAAGVPRTENVTPENAAGFWRSRQQWFFKPAAGYGSKAAYRGDKLTTRVFTDIARGAYVAQALVSPSQRRLLVDGVEQKLKLDLRNYAYGGDVQLVSARLYQGQTTNFRTPGGGFAAVFSVPCRGGGNLCAQ